MPDILDDVKKIKGLDKNNMLDLLLGLDDQCKAAKKIGDGFDPNVDEDELMQMLIPNTT